MSQDIAIIICTEKGPLEEMARLFVLSLREFGGALKDVPVYSYQPRKGWEISRDTREFFKQNHVTLIDQVLNTKYTDYPFANKVLACSHAEQMLKCENLAYLDTDVFFMAEPSEFIITDSYDAVLRPVDSKNVGAENEEDPNWEYWRKLYSLAGSDTYEYVTASVDQKRILSYWNGGHLIVRRKRNIFQKWEENFHKAMKQGLAPDEGIFYLEQSLFAATVSAMNCKVRQFSHVYNYPIHLQSRIPDPEKRIRTISEAVTVHYHRIFTENHAKTILAPMIDPKDEKSRWLIQNLENLGFMEKGLINTTPKIARQITDDQPETHQDLSTIIQEQDMQIELLKSRIQNKNKRIKRLEEAITREKEKVETIKRSMTWKAGRTVIMPFILLYSLIKKINGAIRIRPYFLRLIRNHDPLASFVSPRLKDKISPTNRKVIYTVIIGEYDTLKDPVEVLDDWDYICFTDSDKLQSSVWRIVRVKCPAGLHPKRCASYFILYPFKYLKDYELSLMIGGMISIQCDLNEFVEANLPVGRSLSVSRHPKRDCIYEEAERVKELKKAVSKEVDKQMNKYREEGFPAHYGLVQSGVVLRRHHDVQMIRFMQLWLREVIRESQRDQLSFNYLLWKHGLVEPYFMDPGIFSNEFRVRRHNFTQQFG